MVALPKTAGRDMKFYYINSTDELKPGRFGIPEPQPEEGTREALPDEADVMIIPGVAYDRQHNRVGHGAGYYDRYISSAAEKAILTVAPCFDFQLFDRVETDPWDLPVDVIVTPSVLF